MDKAEQRTRIHCDALCQLSYEGKQLQGMIENVSLTGALIKVDNTIPMVISPGVTCSLMLYGKLPDDYTEYKCLAVRVDSNRIGLQFLEINYC